MYQFNPPAAEPTGVITTCGVPLNLLAKVIFAKQPAPGPLPVLIDIVPAVSVPLIEEVAADAIGDAKCDRVMAAMVSLSSTPFSNHDKVGQLFRQWLTMAIEQYAAALDKLDAEGMLIRFSNEREVA